ncbi:MAG: acetolactate decarboxylase, partial [Candidatus Omnitrophica bacterium]|nr:acetolactate decarboxylase [Candidatus Omnitrophota bacterium]
IWSPEYIRNTGVPGYHFHFIDDKLERGGHLLDCNVTSAAVQIDPTTQFYMKLPNNERFLKADLSNENAKSLEMVETGNK